MEKRTKKILTRVALITLLALVVSALLLQIDDELDPEAKTMLDSLQYGGESQAYFYLLGIDAASNKDPIEVGKVLYASIKEAEVKYFDEGQEYEYEGLDDKKDLPLPGGEAFCQLNAEECIGYLLGGEYDIREILNKYAVLKERYSQLIKLDDYKSLSRPVLMMRFPSYQYIARGNRLSQLQALLMMRESDIDSSVNTLIQNISDLRKQLERADDLIGKMIYLSQISDSLDVLSVICEHEKYTLTQHISPLTLDERKLDTVMNRELVFGYNIVSKHWNDPEFLGLGKLTPDWIVRIFFKVNMTMNAIYPLYKDAIYRSNLDQKEFALAVEAGEMKALKTSYVRNIAGSIMNDMAVSFDRYIDRLFALNAKIYLFNQTGGVRSLSSVVGNINNPYYSDKGKAYLSDDMKSVCAEGPFEDNEKYRCLRVKI